jgi:hypothetical protein
LARKHFRRLRGDLVNWPDLKVFPPFLA